LRDVQALYSDPQINLRRLAACTVLIVHGAEDKIVPVAVGRDLHARIPRSRLTELPGRGHYFLYEPSEMESLLTELQRAHQDCPAAVSG
jgi:pimeloyl-ACP methyl ester carboxylesterase